LIGAWIAAVAGDNVGYEFGKRVGRKLFRRKESLLFKPENVIKAQEFYEKHGGKAIVLARFMPIVRTFVPVVAGIGHMDHKKFTFFNFLGLGA
jgi:membrane-associated protein